MKKLLTLPLFFAMAALFMLNSCSKDDSDGNQVNPGSQKVMTTVVGRLVDEAGNPVSGATVSLEGQSTMSDLLGLFLFKNISVNKGRCVLSFSKTGYINQYYGCKPSKGKTTYVKPVLVGHEMTQNINSASGGTITLPNGGSVEFPANAFVNEAGVAYTGSVEVRLTLLNSDDAAFSSKLPGRDMRATDASGNTRILYSYGMMNIELFGQASEKLNLAAGKTATLTFPVTQTQQSSAPSSIPLWYFDEETALWKEEGTALKNSSEYSAEVSHFTWWNCDYPYPLAYISGHVVSCNGTPVSNIYVYADYSAGYVTNNQGYFAGDAPANYGMFEMYAESWSSDVTQSEFVPSLTPGQNYTVPHLVFSDNGNNTTVAVQGEIVDCNGYPSDGFIVFSEPLSGFYTYQYIVGGFYSIMLENFINYDITVVNNGQYGQATLNLNSPNPCNALAVPDIAVCNSISSAGSNFTTIISSPVIGTQTLHYYVNNCQAGLLPSPYIFLTATDSANNSSGVLNMKINNYQPGSYIWNTTTNGIVFNATLDGIPVTMTSVPGGLTTVTSAPAVGGMVNVSYNGNVLITSTQLPAPLSATITGFFNVRRNN
jgi:hypothetical protein